MTGPITPAPDDDVSADRVQRFTHNAHSLVYETFGDGPRVIVLLHGVLLDAELNRALAQSLASHGNQVILLELLGHGRSDRPLHATEHRMDSYADQVVGLLDHLEVEEAVIGGTSLGANVSLHVANRSPERVRAMFIEMPVLEWAAPAAGAVFIPLLLGVRFGWPIAQLVGRTARRLPRTGYGVIDTFLNAASMEPREIAAILHGLLVGPTAPSIEDRRAIQVPTLVIGHDHDAIHPFNDATNLVEQLPNAELLRARSALELRVRPTRLTGEIASFLDRVWRPRAAAAQASS